MDITPDEKRTLRAKVRDAIGAGLVSGRVPEAPPMPPSRSEIDKASEWAVGELVRFLASRHWEALQDCEELEKKVRRLKAENRRLRKATTAPEAR
ncbi:hypothetical protein ABZ234_03930 [Nocardiopsis sp. NPDC006198]|uniref:hypothetical protein n=1 Tax=Nocardiopsis sp. NPDC006198 TaxID=3154472 RepID=UPI0033AE23A7